MSQLSAILIFIAGGLLTAFVGMWATRAESEFFQDERRVRDAAERARDASWRIPLARVGAAAQLSAFGAMMAVCLILILILVLGAERSAAWAGLAMLACGAVFLLCGPVALASVLLCRCGRCAGALFDNGRPARKGTVAWTRENWRMLIGRGACPRCGASVE